MWSLKGQQPEILTYGGRQRQQLIGAVDPLFGRVHVALSDTLKASHFQHFLEGLINRYKNSGKILMILDNARAHHSKELKPFLEANKDKLELLFLPLARFESDGVVLEVFTQASHAQHFF